MAGLPPKYEKADIVQPGGRPIPEALEPRMGTYFVKRGDLRLRVMFASAPSDKPRGSIIFSPGRTEFIEKYLETATDLLERGFNILIVDPRGQGLSDRLLEDKMKSYVDSFQDYADDLAFVTEELLSFLPKPHIVMGHSMGGTIVLQAVLSGVINPSAIVCSAPMLGLYDLDTPLMKGAIRALSAMGLKAKNLPFQRQRNGLPVPFNSNKLTSDKDRYRHWAAYFQTTPRLRVGPPTYGWIVQALKSMSWVNRNAAELNIPCLIVAAGADPIVDPASNEDFASKARGTFKVVPGALHELFLERDVYRDQFFAAFDKFLDDNAL
ncbi:MAG: alpha/beta hydrolase [Hellea sp.]